MFNTHQQQLVKIRNYRLLTAYREPNQLLQLKVDWRYALLNTCGQQFS